MGILKRLLGICATQLPANSGCWTYADGKLEVILDKAPELSRKGGAVRLEGKEYVVRDGDVLTFRFSN